MEKTNETTADINKKRGERLKIAREAYRPKLTQEKFAELCHYSAGSYISEFENGRRDITWDHAVKWAEILHVSPAYLMCETDNPKNAPFAADDLTTFGDSDIILLGFLIHRGNIIKACVRLLSDHGKMIETKWGNQRVYDSIETPWGNLRDYTFSDSRCIYLDGESKHEAIITDVILNGRKLPYSAFCFMIHRLYDYIDFTLEKMPDFHFDHDICDGVALAANDYGFKNPNELTKEIEDIEEWKKELSPAEIKEIEKCARQAAEEQKNGQRDSGTPTTSI